MRAFCPNVLIAAMLMSVSGMARGADIRVLGIDVVQDAVRALAEEFGKESRPAGGAHVSIRPQASKRRSRPERSSTR